PPQLPQRHQPTRHRPIRPPARILFRILKLIGDAQQQERPERNDKRHHERHHRGPRLAPAAQQRRIAHRRRAERRDQRPVRRQRKPLLLIYPPTVHVRAPSERRQSCRRHPSRSAAGLPPLLRPLHFTPALTP